MSLQASYTKKTFKFKFDAGTSRGVLKEKDAFFIFIYDEANKKTFGIGEAAPLKGLSEDDVDNFEEVIQHVIYNFNLLGIEVFEWNINIIVNQLIEIQFPSLRFAFETALYDYMNGGKRQIFANDFSVGKRSLPINGLIWMGEEAFMKEQIAKKLSEGYNTIKMKVGAIDFDAEVRILESMRTKFDENKLTLRVDANGAFDKQQAIGALKVYKKLKIHSIEQPIKAGQLDDMAELCQLNILPIALDEELIGVHDYVRSKQLLKQIRPQFIILKPTLVGGFQACREWIDAANQFEIGWWATSALESNIGLNAVAQFTAEYQNLLPQGLGTGQLYEENIESPLLIEDGNLTVDVTKVWQTDNFFDDIT